MSTKTLEEIMRQIEVEAEAKVIKGYKTGLLNVVAVDNTLVVEPQVSEPNKQLDFLKNIMKEGAKKFEAATGRHMTYLEMRHMFG
jgi:hypothetical protein